MRALLVVNPKATTTSDRGRDLLVRALRSEVDLTVEFTRRRGHAAELAEKALALGVDVVVTLGGDGTVNEVVNGLLRDGPGEHVPALAVVPGGSTNVFARALGLPKEWAEGSSVILEALHSGRVRHVGLGKADGRYFTFCAGVGLDAEVVRRVERARLGGRTSKPSLYIRSAMTQFLRETDSRHPQVTLERPGEESELGIASVIVQNTSPWTFIGEREVNACPEASFDTGLDIMALRGFDVPNTTRTVAQLLAHRPPRGRQVLALHDVPEFTIYGVRPVAFQLDGEYLGERSKMTFTAVPEALRVFC